MGHLEITPDIQGINKFILPKKIIQIGRCADNDLIPDQMMISRYHAQIVWDDNNSYYYIVDLGSSGGTKVNGEDLSPKVPRPLNDQDVIEIGNYKLKYYTDQSVTQTNVINTITPTILTSQCSHVPAQISSQLFTLVPNQKFTLGRKMGKDIVIEHPSVSRDHAQIEWEHSYFYITDLNSTNGTYVNGQKITKKYQLRGEDIIYIGATRLLFESDNKSYYQLTVQNEQGNLRLDAIELNREVTDKNNKKVNLLQNISVSIFPKEFVVVAGVSGGGKSTLLNALNGFIPASSGKVLINGVNLYQNFNVYRSEIGYVPQQDIIHKSLTIKQTLDYAAKLRMSSDTTPQERDKRVTEVLADLELTHRQNVAVEKLSGGQLKRVSMGVELLTKPSLFFLDEATSGLDPGTEAEMMKLLRKVADDGRTVLLITHATENVMLCDLVVFLAEGGYLAFYGSPTEALTHFGVQKFNQIYNLVYHTQSPQEWQEKYVNSSYYKTYIVARQKTIPNQSNNNVKSPLANNRNSANSLLNLKTIKANFQQFYVLFWRNLDLWKTDKISFWLTLSIAPLLGSLDFILWKRNLFDIKIGSGQQSIMMLFITAIIAIMVGSLSSMREIVKEKDIYRRERMVFLQIIPYISSKVALGVLISLYQAVIFLLFKYASISWTDGVSILPNLYLTLALTTMGGMVMGLLVSAVSPNQNFAQLLIILFLIPQITFGTGILPISALGDPAKLISNITISKWSFESMMTIARIGEDLAEDKCLFDYSEKDRKNLKDSQKESDCSCVGKNLFKKCQFPGIQDKYVTEVDAIEPKKPEDPGPFSTRRLESYKNKVNKYKEDVNLWQDEYSKWKGKRESAIGEAEGIINKFYLDYGSAFNVNLSEHWQKLGLIIMVMLGLILVIMKSAR